ncbi:MAG: AAA family ATPase [Jiangellaceae bacterium]
MGDEYGGNSLDLGGYDPVGATWAPVDLGPWLRGEHVTPQPTIGVARTDGLRLLYPGKEHAVIGEMESGKSWLALACVKAEIVAGNRVVYVHFEEADPGDTIERLRALDVRDDEIAARFTFVGPNEPVDPWALAALLDPPPSLVVLDGINEAMSLHRYNPREEDGVALFRARLVKPCTAVGAAVLSADHVVKDRERRDRTPIGSVHKGNGLTGSLLYLDNVAPFGRGERGCSHVYVTKDRPGYLRRHGRPGRTPGRTYMGSLIVDDTRTLVPTLDLAFIEPPDEPQREAAVSRDQADDETVLTVVVEVAAAGVQPSQRTVEAKTSGMSCARIRNALTRLVLDKRLTEREGPRRSRLFTIPTASTASGSDHAP